MWNEKREEQVKELCRELVRNESISGNEKAAVECLSEFMKSVGYDSVNIDKYGSLVGCIKGNRPGPKVLFDGHLDEVAVTNPEEWKYPPFEAEEVDGKIYGRGTSDMKGAVAAMACAAATFAEDCNRDFPGEIYVSGVVHEECFEGIAARSISNAVNPDYVIIGESTQLNLRIGQRGRAEIVVETFGVPAHSANPEKGINAVMKMAEVIKRIEKLPLTEHPKLGKGNLVLTDILSSPYPGASVIPDHCRTTYDRRLLVGETLESVLAPIQKLLDEIMKEDPDLKAKVSYAYGVEKCYTGETIEGERFFPAWIHDENEEYVQKVLSKLRENGFEPEVGYYNFCTNGSHYGGEKGIKVLGLGPSKENLAHVNNEYIELSQLYGVTKAYMAVAEALLTEEN